MQSQTWSETSSARKHSVTDMEARLALMQTRRLVGRRWQLGPTLTQSWSRLKLQLCGAMLDKDGLYASRKRFDPSR